MRCKKHLADLSSTVGVCASCLRERLSSLVAAQAHVQQAHQQLQIAGVLSRASAVSDDPRKSDSNHPPPLLFPRSVSPYVSRRKSEEATWQDNNRGDHRFYSTPQLGPTYGATIANAAYECNTAKGGFRKKQGKFSIFANLFRSRSDDFESDPRFTSRDSCEPSSSSSSSPSWFDTIFPGRRKKQSAMISVEGNTVTCQRPRQLAHRGMSPAGAVDFDEGCDGYDRSPSGSGNSSELSPKWRKTPIVAPPSARRSGRNVSGITFCLSPLVRASPNWHCKKSMPPDLTVSSEIRFTGKPQLSSAVDYYGNRSRKLADFGRSNRNR